MNRNVILATALAALMLSACGGGNNAKTPDVQDSDANATTESASEPENQKVATNAQTPDMVFYEVKGPVKTIYTGRYSRVDFDRDGNVTSVNGMDVFSDDYPTRLVAGDGMLFLEIYGMRRDKGLIISDAGYEGATDYKWKDGRLSGFHAQEEGMAEDAVYHYDSDGNVVKIEYHDYSLMGGDEETSDRSVTYKYTKADSHGNWTERRGDDLWDEKRFIVYYDEPQLLPDGYASFDLAFFEAAGPVRKIKDEYRLLEFDREGNLQKINGKNPFAARPEEWQEGDDNIYYTKDKFGKIVKMESPYSYREYTWVHGYVLTEKSFDEGGEITETSADMDYVTMLPRLYIIQFGEDLGDEPEMGEPRELDVKDQKLDSHGNWTSRKVDDEAQERTIEYW